MYIIQEVVQRSLVVVFEVAVVVLRRLVAIVWIGSCNQNRAAAQFGGSSRACPGITV